MNKDSHDGAPGKCAALDGFQKNVTRASFPPKKIKKSIGFVVIEFENQYFRTGSAVKVVFQAVRDL